MPSTARIPPLNVRTRPSASMPCSVFTPPLCRFGALQRSRGGCEALEEGANRLSSPFVHEPAVFVEMFPGERHGDLGLVEHDRAGKEQGIADLLLGAPCAAATRRCSDHRRRLPAQDRGHGRAREPVDRVLEHARGAAVVFRGGKEESVRVSNGVPQRGNRLRIPCRLHVGVVERNGGEVELLDLDAVRGQLAGSLKERSIVRALPQAPGDAEDSRHWRTAVMSAVISTRVGPHSIAPSTRKRVFSSPSASVPAPWNLASSSTAIGTSLIVSSPMILLRSPSTCSMRFDSKRISGKRSTSSRSGERRCASRCSWSVRTLAVRTTPFVRPGSTVPSKSVKRPLIDLNMVSVSITSNRMLE